MRAESEPGHYVQEGHPREALDLDQELDALASEWSDISWQADQALNAIREEARRSIGVNPDRLKALQSEIEDLRDRQQGLLARRARAENRLFGLLGI